MTQFQLGIHMFLQLALIITACRAVGLGARYLGQPQVVGEMIAGVILGPSVLGLLMGDSHQWLFPKVLTLGTSTIPHPSMTVLYCFAQVGLVLYMFIVGLEFRPDLLRKAPQQAAAVSLAGIAVPFLLGGILALYYTGDSRLWTSDVGVFEQVLFLGASMSITAFPMLARIIFERGLTGTAMGTLALAAGAMDDALAWCMLAVVLASFKSEPQLAYLAIGGGILYAIILILIGRPILTRLLERLFSQERTKAVILPLVIALLMLAAWLTDLVGIYAVFGAFILGSILPKGAIAQEIIRKLEPLTVNFLLPLFFIYSGLNTRIDLILSSDLLFLTLIVLLAACLGKGVACALAARVSGQSVREACGVGALMNARGLMELIILNIGLEHGVITPQLFTIMVAMAIVTTLLATPCFNLFCGPAGIKSPIKHGGPIASPAN